MYMSVIIMTMLFLLTAPSTTIIVFDGFVDHIIIVTPLAVAIPRIPLRSFKTNFKSAV